MEPTVQGVGARKSQDILRAELERQKRNQWKIYNPTNQDFEVILNAKISPEVWTVKAKEELIVPYYVAEKYFDEMADKVIYTKSDKAVIEENEKRMGKGIDKMDLHTEQPRFENRNLKNLIGKKEQIVKILDRGLYKEYGVAGQTSQPTDNRQAKETFDPGINLETGDIVPEAPVVPQKQPEETLTEQVVDDNNMVFKCEVCGKEFTTKIALSGHSRSHKTETEVSPVKVEEEDDE